MFRLSNLLDFGSGVSTTVFPVPISPSILYDLQLRFRFESHIWWGAKEFKIKKLEIVAIENNAK